MVIYLNFNDIIKLRLYHLLPVKYLKYLNDSDYLDYITHVK